MSASRHPELAQRNEDPQILAFAGAGALQPKDLLVTSLLASRTPHQPDLGAEIKAVYELSERMLERPADAVQRFVELALELCSAGTAGLGVLTKDAQGMETFRWDALAGAFASRRGASSPRHSSPCGLCLDEGKPILLAYPARVFAYLDEGSPPIVETLIVPLYDTGHVPLAALWVATHDERHPFDAEHVRIMTQLGTLLVMALKLTQWPYAQLTEARDAAERANEAKTRLIATIGHDLRQPLTVIMGFIDMMAARPEIRGSRLLGHAEKAAARLDQAIYQMMEAGRLELSVVEPKIEPCALAEIFDEIREQHIDAAESKGLDFPVSACPLTILSDPNLLRTVLHNLVGNAVKYTKTGRVLLDGRIENDHAVIEVSDTGPGIPADKLELIFDEFQQLDIEHAGVGLGLAIAKRTADLLGHPLTVQSTPGQGACFNVTVPLAPPSD